MRLRGKAAATRRILGTFPLVVALLMVFAQTAQAATIQISVTNFQFNPSSPKARQGDTIQWNFNGGTHTATDTTGMALYDSGSKSSGSFPFIFTSAGKFSYQCKLHPGQMQGVIKVPVKVNPASGGTGTDFTITMASVDPPNGFVLDLKVTKPNSTTQTFSNLTSRTFHFTPNAGTGTYKFQARLRKATGGAASFSSTKAVTVG